jgi:DTW domain-containing protein YfiP/ribosomal protein S18 acetylase RimI-like enzyme
MADIEPIKPTNTGWLIADVVADTYAFGWARTEADPALLALLADPQWQPYLVFPGEFVTEDRVVTGLIEHKSDPPSGAEVRPLFVLLDATWQEARKMFRKSPYLDHLPVLSLQPEQLSRYRLRRAQRAEHLCTAEVATLCLEMAGETQAAEILDAWFDVFCDHYLTARRLVPVDHNNAAHQRLRPFSRTVPVRLATAMDGAAVAEVLMESRLAFMPYAPSAHTPDEDRNWVRNYLIPRGNVFVSSRDERVVAVLAVSRDQGFSWIDQLYVLPGFEAQGLGLALLHHAHAMLERPIRLYTFQANTVARHFYERHGYKAIQYTDGSSNEERCPDVLYELTEK